MTSMPLELVRTTTEDGFFLDGAYALPTAARGPEWEVDAVLLVHGTGGNFYSPGVLETFSQQALDAGLPTLRINTRGHDQISSIPGRGRSMRGGAAYEIISDCRYDLRAWLDWLAALGHSRIALVGHSMGGVKSLYTAALEGHSALRWVMAISPPRFCHGYFVEHPQAGPFRADYLRAQQLAASGAGETLTHFEQPLPMLLSASSFLAKYGPHDAYDFLPLLPKIVCPVLLLLGSRCVETSIAFSGTPAALAEICPDNPHVTWHLIDGTDTNFTDCPQIPFERARASWRIPMIERQ